jgi:membrane protein implicated in regulation of membrane protease activity
VPAWIGWLLAAGVLGIAELLTLTFVLGMLAVAAGTAALAAALGGGAGIAAGTFVAVSALLLAGVRPVARRHLTSGPTLRIGPQKLVGSRAIVVQPVDADGGQVRISGELWSARAYDETQHIPAGTTVQVLLIEGATALVHAEEPLT